MMPWAAVTLTPGTNVEETPTKNQAGYLRTLNGRFKASLFQKLGGWTKYVAITFSGTIKSLWGWQDLANVKRLSVATTNSVTIVSESIPAVITPQLLETDGASVFSTTSGDATVGITDANTNGLTTNDHVYFRTPVSIGGIILSGIYPIDTITSTTAYTIEAQSLATTTRANLTISGITQANPGVVTYVGADNIANGDLIYITGVVGMTQVNGRVFTVANLNTGANTFQLSGINTTGFGAYVSGGVISFGIVPEFTTASGSNVVSVRLADHGQVVGNPVVFDEPTTVGGVTISGKYVVISITNADAFTITVGSSASSTATAMMNSGNVGFTYYIALGPVGGGVGYGLGDYGEGGYGLGTSATAAQTGTPITADDWTQDNWGEILLACPTNGAIYYWQPNSGFQNLAVIGSGPLYNIGMFVSMAQQQVIAFGTSIDARDGGGIGIYQDPMLIGWSDIGDFFQWAPLPENFARNYRVPTGSKCIGGAASKNRNLVWTDLDLHAGTFNGGQSVYSWNRVGSNCGLIGMHAWAQQADTVYWMGVGNFFSYAGSGVQPIPCTVWDDVFQVLDPEFQHRVVCASNSDFTEIWWFYPSTTSNGVLTKYAKFNVVEGTWDNGNMDRSAWLDRSVLGNPLGSSSTGIVYSHESGFDDDDVALVPLFETGDFYISDGEEFVFIDQVYPDFKWGISGGSETAQVLITLLCRDAPGETQREYGPFVTSKAVPFFNPANPDGTRVRTRQCALRVQSIDVGSFWRLGKVRFRYSSDGRR
jgi:hypothetical protein